jgi:hypothetical protein
MYWYIVRIFHEDERIPTWYHFIRHVGSMFSVALARFRALFPFAFHHFYSFFPSGSLLRQV